MRRSSRLFVVLLLLGLAACETPPETVGMVATPRSALALPHASWDRLELAWTMGTPPSGLEGELRVLVHLEDGSGRLVRTFDHAFPVEWAAGGEAVYPIEVFQSALAPPLELGDYALSIGLYDGAGHRWPVETAGGGSRIATVRVIEPGSGFPEFSFSAEWLPVEAGTDLQVLVRRWLEGPGAIRVRGLEAPGSLRLRLGIPRAGGTQEMVLGEGATRPAVKVRADCTAFEAELAGIGSHTIEIPLSPDGDIAGECRLRFSANFELISNENREKRTIALENLAWRAGS